MRTLRGAVLLGLVLAIVSLTTCRSPKPPEVTFRYPKELPLIREVARREAVDPTLLMAIRQAEGGKKYPFGIMPGGKYKKSAGYKDGGQFRKFSSALEKQAVWCAWTIKANQSRWARLSWWARLWHWDFINFLGSRYAPIGAGNDPKGLNRNWVRNVTRFYDSFK